MITKLPLRTLWYFLQQYTAHFVDPPPPTPPPTTPVPMVPVDIGQSIPHSPQSDISNCPAPNNINITSPKSSPTIPFHPITLLIRELELGKSLLTIGLPITIAVLISNNDSKKFHTTFTYRTLSGLFIGSMAILNGILLKTSYPRTANVVEQLGILMVLLSFTGLLASALPPEFTWVPILCSALSLFPFILQVFSYCTPNQIQTEAT